jgi:serine/threonine protein kinase
VKLIDYDSTDLSLIFEYAGICLDKFVDDRKMSNLSDNIQNTIMLDMSNALEYIHNQNIIHLDIKTSNILIDDTEKRAVLCDFGLSHRSSISQIYSTGGGTPSYIPPEYLLDQRRGKAGDIWAFGVTLLFVFGIIPLPCEYWDIAEAAKAGKSQAKMRKWHTKVKNSIPAKRYPLLCQMLVTQDKKRITASQLVSSLQKTQQRASSMLERAA